MRAKIVALLLSLFALWAFAAYVTLREGLNLLAVGTLDSRVAQPSDRLLTELQQERRLSLVYLGKPGARAAREALAAQRVRTDEARATFKERASGTTVDMMAGTALEQRIDAAFTRLDQLDGDRQAIDATGGADRGRAAAVFTVTIDAIFDIYDVLGTLDDKELTSDIRTLIQLNRARDLVSQEDALVAGVLSAGRLTERERTQLTQMVGAHQFYSRLAADQLPAEDRARYDEMANGATFSRFQLLEERLMDADVDAAPPVEAADWDAAAPPALEQYATVISTGGDAIVGRATPVAAGVILRLVLAGGLGLVALIFSIVISITTARAIVEQLHRLRLAAADLANERLPGVVERLRRGEKVDVAAESPPLTFGDDEIGQVGQAINSVQETAIRAAVEQAELRTGVRDLFLGLARRQQALVHRQLTVLDEIERRENDPAELAEMFKVDHLATRMRRNAENLIVLSGAVPGRRWRNPIPFIDVVRGAVAEVEDYTRVSVLPIDTAALAGRAVSDVIHLLAELIENAASFSPPYTMVNVSGQKVANGFVVEVEDRGLGMKDDDELAAANDLVRDPPDFNLSSTARLGLFVVGQLAKRHAIDVRLRRSPYGGITAIVLIPSTLVVFDQDDPPSGASEAAPVAVGGRPREEDDTQTLPLFERPAVDRPGLDRRPRAAQPLRGVSMPPAAPRVVPPVEPAPPGGEGDPAPQDPPRTSAGLPFRVRQASLAAPLREEPMPEPDPLIIGKGRSPDETRDMMASYQAATRRGREAAQRLAEAADSASESAPGSAPTDGDPADEHPER
ncbi:nitrate- and nitrite sensing domain-containing protein [Actinomycetes bacterium KLBMP 9797]